MKAPRATPRGHPDPQTLLATLSEAERADPASAERALRARGLRAGGLNVALDTLSAVQRPGAEAGAPSLALRAGRLAGAASTLSAGAGAALLATGGALSLTGVGAVAGVPMMAAGKALLLGGSAARLTLRAAPHTLAKATARIAPKSAIARALGTFSRGMREGDARYAAGAGNALESGLNAALTPATKASALGTRSSRLARSVDAAAKELRLAPARSATLRKRALATVQGMQRASLRARSNLGRLARGGMRAGMETARAALTLGSYALAITAKASLIGAAAGTQSPIHAATVSTIAREQHARRRANEAHIQALRTRDHETRAGGAAKPRPEGKEEPHPRRAEGSARNAMTRALAAHTTPKRARAPRRAHERDANAQER